MKTLIVLMIGVAFANATGPVCVPLVITPIPPNPDQPNEVSPCFIKDLKTGADLNMHDAGEEKCATLPGCCTFETKCVAGATGSSGSTQNAATVRGEFYSAADLTEKKAEDEYKFSRSLLAYPPGLPLAPGCYPPVPFPANCKVTPNEPYVLTPPVNVPYCVRIPCKRIGNARLDKSLKMCGSEAGCYFDKELYEYREAFGPSVLPGVPVCHLAIRNKVFQQRSQAVVQKYGKWNPYFTNCVLRRYDADIRIGPKGCELLPILDAFYITPKMAGWKTINSYECALIDGCWRPGRGCFYPVDISKVRVKSGQREITFQRNEVVYGRPKCQAFDSSTPLNILKSYHRCLSAGCTVDSSVTSLYYNHLYSLGEGLTSENHWKFWTDVGRGHVGAYNVDSVLNEYGPTVGPTGPVTPPVFSTPGPPGVPFDFPGGPGPAAGSGPLFTFAPPTHDTTRCGEPFKAYGGRPCPPPKFSIGKPKAYCPYKPFFVPRFGVLKGSFEGCCDINLCYLPKSEISKMHSGPSVYYSEWSLYTRCSASCGQGEQKRYRRCISLDKTVCNEKVEEVKSCNLGQCPGWGQWTSYSPCPASCFPGGIRTRTRQCFPPGSFCGINGEETIQCNTHTCPNDGGYVPSEKPYVSTTTDPFGFSFPF